jgi:hypothetical protein
MDLKAGVTSVANLDIEAFKQAAEQDGWHVFVLPDSIESRDGFFDAVRARLPLDPPLLSHRSWDALADSLWEGIDATTAERIVIVWPSSTKLCVHASSDYETAVSILADLAASDRSTKTLAVILA